MLLFEDISFNIDKWSFFVGPVAGVVIVWWQQNADKLFKSSSLLIMNGYQEFILIRMFFLSEWTIQNGIVLGHCWARQHVFDLKSCLILELVLDVFYHLFLALCEGDAESVGLINEDSLICGSCNNILGLSEGEGISWSELGFEDSINLFVLNRLVNDSLCKESTLSVEESGVVLDLLLEVRCIRVKGGPHESSVLAELNIVPVEDWVLCLFFLALEGFNIVTRCRLDDWEIYILKLRNGSNKIINLFPVR